MPKPLRALLNPDTAGGLALIMAAALAMIIANSPLDRRYEELLHLPVIIEIASFRIDNTLLHWINEGLMAVFFFRIGLELKREALEGHLSDRRRASLPAVAAAGGMLVPAACYFLLNRGEAAALRGWAIPMATDIAFALGVLSLLGKRVPAALRAFLLSVAVVDDIGAILVIAIFYTSSLSMTALVFAAGLMVVLFVLNRAGVSNVGVYLLFGIPLWAAVLKTGVHATLVGVVLGMFIPLKRRAASSNAHANSPLLRLEHALDPWVAFVVLPAFALANAGVPLAGLSLPDLIHPVPLGIAAGLFVGKQAGIMGFCWLAARLRIASLPKNVGWPALYGTALLCGIGFTMSLFIALLAFGSRSGAEYQTLARLGILIGTAISGLSGYFILRSTARAQSSPH